ncbi:hypothetical protein B0H13DRAFT_293326 [Mycena leptocephala]|nr:hypothetical protein B0H13DRAFT_293326 [Mycena leptocephala]
MHPMPRVRSCMHCLGFGFRFAFWISDYIGLDLAYPAPICRCISYIHPHRRLLSCLHYFFLLSFPLAYISFFITATCFSSFCLLCLHTHTLAISRTHTHILILILIRYWLVDWIGLDSGLNWQMVGWIGDGGGHLVVYGYR